jgi:hypothetical protein
MPNSFMFIPLIPFIPPFVFAFGFTSLPCLSGVCIPIVIGIGGASPLAIFLDGAESYVILFLLCSSGSAGTGGISSPPMLPTYLSFNPPVESRFMSFHSLVPVPGDEAEAVPWLASGVRPELERGVTTSSGGNPALNPFAPLPREEFGVRGPCPLFDPFSIDTCRGAGPRDVFRRSCRVCG